MNQFVDPNGRADSFLDIILSHFQVPMSAKSSFNLEIFLREKAAPPWMLRANHVLAGRPRVWGLAVKLTKVKKRDAIEKYPQKFQPNEWPNQN